MNQNGTVIVTESASVARDYGMYILRAFQMEARKVLLVFVTGTIIGIFTLRSVIWPFFQTVMRSRMSDKVSSEVKIITQTPFDVFFVQVKVGLFFGLIATLPVLLYSVYKYDLGRIKTKTSDVPKHAFIVPILVGTLLFVGGLAYSYTVFFPIVFEFLARVTVESGFTPTYSISKWTKFIVLLSVSFGLIAQIPLFLPVLVRYDVVEYEKVREGWRYWVLITLTLGAFLSPPEPISQLLWALPLIILYFVSVGVCKLVSTSSKTQKSSDQSTSNSTTSENQNISVNPNPVEPEQNPDFGGYLRYIQLLASATSKNVILILTVFLVSMIVTFYAMYLSITEIALGVLKSSLVSPESFDVIALHPVELLVFQAKSAILIALVITLPIAVYKVWPDLAEEANISMRRVGIIKYILVILVTTTASFIAGFVYISPEILNFLVEDAERIDALVTYQINSFFWISIYISIATASVATIYVLSVLLYVKGFEEIETSWRKVLFGLFLGSVLATPSSVIKAVMLFLPACASYLLAILTIKISSYLWLLLCSFTRFS